MPPPAPPDRRPLPPGEVLGGCRLERLVHEGGWGHVYLGTDLASGARVTLKHFRPQPGPHAPLVRAQEAFVGAARLLARLDHPGLLRVERWWVGDDEAGWVSPRVEGQTLAAWRERQPQPPDEAWLRDGLLKPLLGALQSLHEAGRLHGDIAPDNVLLRPDGRPLLLDFGASRRLLQPREESLERVVNPGFAPLEQHRPGRASGTPGPWTDLHALAALARFALTGRQPPSAVLREDDEDALQPLVQLPLIETGGCSERLLAEIDRTMALHPSGRPGSAEEWRRALRATTGGEGQPRVDALIRMAFGKPAAEAAAPAGAVPPAEGARPAAVPLHAAPAAAPLPRWAGGGPDGELPLQLRTVPRREPLRAAPVAAPLPLPVAAPAPVPSAFREEDDEDGEALSLPPSDDDDDAPAPRRSRRLLPRVLVGALVAVVVLGSAGYVGWQRQRVEAVDGVSRLLREGPDAAPATPPAPAAAKR